MSKEQLSVYDQHAAEWHKHRPELQNICSALKLIDRRLQTIEGQLEDELPIMTAREHITDAIWEIEEEFRSILRRSQYEATHKQATPP